jgi:LmbE family N-acetylglucosaminyl deacetylase
VRFLLTVVAALVCGLAGAQPTNKQVVLIVTADAEDYLLCAGGTIAAMIDGGAEAYVLRVTNDEKSSRNLSPEETAVRIRAESESAAAILRVKEVIPMGYRAAELADVPFTTLRDRLVVYIRHYRPAVLFIPNPYTEYDRVLDRYYTGRAAEDAWRAASLDNHVPPFGVLGLRPHITPEVFYYSQPVDPRRRDPESTAAFVPEPKVLDISGTFARKVKAVQALRTVNYSTAMQLKERLGSTGRRLPLLDVVNDASVNKLAEENVRGLARIAAEGSAFPMAEEFRHAGVKYRIPTKYLQ